MFDEVAAEYPDIEADHLIIDIGAARVAAQPEQFDVIVTLNLYGDILSDITAQIAGSVGLAGSANIGADVAMFEAVHGSAPDIAGCGIANPSGLLVAATQMLVHLGVADVAQTIKNAWLRTLEDGIHTADIYDGAQSQQKVSTEAFTDAVIERLGAEPSTLTPVRYRSGGIRVELTPTPDQEKVLRGVDVFIDWDGAGRDPDVIGQGLEEAAKRANWRLKMITNRGCQGLSRRPPRNLLDGSLALPLPPAGRRRHPLRSGARSARRAARRVGRHQDGAPVHVRRPTRLLAGAGRMINASNASFAHGSRMVDGEYVRGRTAVPGTKHGKEQVIAPLLDEHLGVRVVVPDGFDTDRFGTFTSDVDHAGVERHPYGADTAGPGQCPLCNP